MKQLLLLTLIFISLKANSQNDTIYLKADHLIFRGEVFNKINSSGEKNGKWINFEINDYSILSECASGFDIGTGMDWNGYTNGTYVYRALKVGEEEETRIIKKESCDTVNGAIYTRIIAEIIKSKIAPNAYFISGEGMYLNNRKSGLWKYYYESGEKLKTIKYWDGIPSEGFYVFRRDSSIMLSIQKQNGSTWIVSKYHIDGERFEEKIGSIKDFEELALPFEIKVFNKSLFSILMDGQPLIENNEVVPRTAYLIPISADQSYIVFLEQASNEISENYPRRYSKWLVKKINLELLFAKKHAIMKPE